MVERIDLFIYLCLCGSNSGSGNSKPTQTGGACPLKRKRHRFNSSLIDGCSEKFPFLYHEVYYKTMYTDLVTNNSRVTKTSYASYSIVSYVSSKQSRRNQKRSQSV